MQRQHILTEYLGRGLRTGRQGSTFRSLVRVVLWCLFCCAASRRACVHQGRFHTKEHDGNGSPAVWRSKTHTSESPRRKMWANGPLESRKGRKSLRKRGEAKTNSNRTFAAHERLPRRESRAANRRAATANTIATAREEFGMDMAERLARFVPD